MTDIVSFLRARLDEDQRTAELASGVPVLRGFSLGRWSYVDGDYGPTVELGDGRWSRDDVSAQVWQCDDEQDGCPEAARSMAAEGKHMARHDPARALAEVEAKRRILELHKPYDVDSGVPHCGVCMTLGRADFVLTQWLFLTAPCPTLRLLALPFADHPEYDASWRPE